MGTFLQDTLCGDVIDLKTYPCRTVEQVGIISRRPLPLLRRTHDTKRLSIRENRLTTQ
jgi:hypothetical protein